MWDFGVSLDIINNQTPNETSVIAGIDVGSHKSPERKSVNLLLDQIFVGAQLDQLKNPDAAIVFHKVSDLEPLSRYADSLQGASTLDIARFCVLFWEVPLGAEWRPHQSTPSHGETFSGLSYASIRRDSGGMFEQLAEDLKKEARLGGAWSGKPAWGKIGVACSWMGTLPTSIYLGQVYDNSIAAIMPKDPSHLPAIYCFCSSGQYLTEVRKINQKTQVANATLVKVPFDLVHWQKVAIEMYPNGLPKPFSSDSTQWLFNGHPAGADQPLHVALARLVGYLWPRQTGSSFPDCPALGPDGLEAMADEDGIVCLAPVRGEASSVDRLRKLLAAAFGDEWSAAKERELLLATAVDNNAKKPEPDLDSWLRSSFFSEHCKLFQSRPFIWQIWDGSANGFSALVNYHKLAAPNGQGRKTLEQLTFTYLGDWIDRQKLDQAEGINGADDRLAAAIDLQNQLKKILEGEPPYDIFVRWKPLQQQSIGWDPDINDGVRLNIRPFMAAELRKGGKTDAGILRAKPGTIKWAKDRGKEPMRSKEEFPWFWGWDENDHAVATDFGAQIPGASPAGDSFDGNRWNDLHYSRTAKEAARARQAGGKS